jgi:DNA-binding NarL/FixJ family response regulator
MDQLIKVLIVDDQPAAWEGFLNRLVQERDIQSPVIVRTMQDALVNISAHRFDVAILSVPIPNQATLRLIKYLKRQQGTLRLLLRVVHLDVRYALRSFKSGVSGYFPAEISHEEIIKAIRKANSGGKYVIPWLAGKLVEELNEPSEPPPHEFLTDRELTIMGYIASGKSLQEIADKLKIHEKTVSSYRSRILMKMRMKSTPEIKRYVIENHLYE